jgi:hypothetical protein
MRIVLAYNVWIAGVKNPINISVIVHMSSMIRAMDGSSDSLVLF